MLKSQGLQANQDVTFLIDGGEEIRALTDLVTPGWEHIRFCGLIGAKDGGDQIGDHCTLLKSRMCRVFPKRIRSNIARMLTGQHLERYVDACNGWWLPRRDDL